MCRAFKIAGLSVALLIGVAAMAHCEEHADVAPVRFGLITDVHAHDVDSPIEGKWMTNTDERLGAFTDAMNGWQADFVIELGDFINGWVVLGADPGDPARIPDILAWANALYGQFDGPRYHVIGNHDLYNLDKDQYQSILGIESTYYSFDVGGYHFVVLDVQFDAQGSDLANTFTGVAGFVPEQELEWLKLDLEENASPTVVFVHQMLDDESGDWGRPTIANQAEVRSILENDQDVVAVFQGHDHDNAHTVSSGIHYVTFEALVDQDTPASWAAITLDPASQTITIQGTGAQQSYSLSYGSGGG